MTDITTRFSLDKIDHHELLHIFDLRYETCWRVSDHEIMFPAEENYRLKLGVWGAVEQETQLREAFSWFV